MNIEARSGPETAKIGPLRGPPGAKLFDYLEESPQHYISLNTARAKLSYGAKLAKSDQGARRTSAKRPPLLLKIVAQSSRTVSSYITAWSSSFNMKTQEKSRKNKKLQKKSF